MSLRFLLVIMLHFFEIVKTHCEKRLLLHAMIYLQSKLRRELL